MTEKKVNDIFKTKYPDGEIRRPNSTSEGSRYWVVFDKGGKVYSYNAQSYQELLERLGFKVAYAHNIRNAESILSRLKEDLRTENFGLCLSSDKEQWKAKKRADLKRQITDWTEELRYLKEECIQA